MVCGLKGQCPLVGGGGGQGAKPIGGGRGKTPEADAFLVLNSS